MTELTLAMASTIIAAAFEKGAAAKMKPLTIAVLDAGGHLKAFQKQDGASMLRYEIAAGKAYGALAVGMGSRWLDQTARERPHFVEGLNAVSGGVTGDTSDNDELVAVAGIEAAGLRHQVE
ncbi:heme-binding protein [Aminobacter sp. NyZ550]|uniref:GlcG/HbpS family heme-binding protein n=1 Tax=Aminobacter sp. NyZ550 TaxID=2979870 RepID=UPI0021D5E602|nr:heme-binding protein [Aminobacter sp. NyZ550]WAX96281.1 heme-binding protein [Aminobacter sp. NyZ550]